MKAQDPIRSGHMTNRIHGLCQDVSITIESVSGLHRDNVTHEELKTWFKSRLFDIHSALREMGENAHDLIAREAVELKESSED